MLSLEPKGLELLRFLLVDLLLSRVFLDHQRMNLFGRHFLERRGYVVVFVKVLRVMH